MPAFTLVELTPSAVIKAFGPAGSMYEQSILSTMRNIVPAYQGGSYELRRFETGAHALVLNDQEIREITFMHSQASMTLEGASLLANCIVASEMCQFYYEQGDEIQNLFFHDLTFALKDAISNRIRFVMDPSAEDGTRDPTQEEVKIVRSSTAHPEANLIERMLS